MKRNKTMNNSSVDINTCLITTKDNLRKSIDNNDTLNQFCNNKDLLREHVIILKDYDAVSYTHLTLPTKRIV